MPQYIVLPHSPELQVLDRFDVVQSDSDTVPFWNVVQETLAKPITTIRSLIDVIETLSLTLHGESRAPNYRLLQQVLEDHGDFFKTWSVIQDMALELPTLFSPTIAALDPENNKTRFSGRQVACLIIHQFLSTLPKPSWMTDGSQDFGIWFSSPTPHEGAVVAYLTGLFRYFEDIAKGHVSEPAKEISFELRDLNGAIPSDDIAFTHLEVVTASSADKDRLLGLPHGASVISANKDVGFGRTASQEEMVVGASPELCPVVLLAPTLRDGDVIVVQGAQVMITLAGYARTAHFESYVEDMDPAVWKKRTVLFMDALELDSFDTHDSTPDLLPGNVMRELIKAYTAFSARKSDGSSFDVVVTGLWGCRSFGGNRYIKTIIQWIAASFARADLRFVCNGPDQDEFGKDLATFISCVTLQGWKTQRLLDVLMNLGPKETFYGGGFGVITSRLLAS